MWRKKIPVETAADGEKSTPVSGKYRVQPADTPPSYEIAEISTKIEKTDSQNARLLRRGVAKSSPP